MYVCVCAVCVHTCMCVCMREWVQKRTMVGVGKEFLKVVMGRKLGKKNLQQNIYEIKAAGGPGGEKEMQLVRKGIKRPNTAVV